MSKGASIRPGHQACRRQKTFRLQSCRHRALSEAVLRLPNISASCRSPILDDASPPAELRSCQSALFFSLHQPLAAAVTRPARSASPAAVPASLPSAARSVSASSSFADSKIEPAVATTVDFRFAARTQWTRELRRLQGQARNAYFSPGELGIIRRSNHRCGRTLLSALSFQTTGGSHHAIHERLKTGLLR